MHNKIFKIAQVIDGHTFDDLWSCSLKIYSSDCIAITFHCWLVLFSNTIVGRLIAGAMNKNIVENEKLNRKIQKAREDTQRMLPQKSVTSSVPVLLVTYMRSGSSWLGDITSQAKNSFYVYEPFQNIIKQGYYTSGLVCFYNYDQCR